MELVKTFSIEGKEDEKTKQPFGEKYRGDFTIRRPNLADKRNIAIKEASQFSMFGYADPSHIEVGTKFLCYVIIYVEEVAEKELPAWFKMEAILSDLDERAVAAVWQEVTAFTKSF